MNEAKTKHYEGYRIRIDADREVFCALEEDGSLVFRFENKGAEQYIRLTPEAFLAMKAVADYAHKAAGSPTAYQSVLEWAIKATDSFALLARERP
jgi:hypothetical protein